MNIRMRAFLKEIISPVFLKNLRGLSKAIRSYYPDYLFGMGKIRSLKEICIEVTFLCNCRCQMCPLYGIHTDGGKGLLESMKNGKELAVSEFRKLFEDLKKLGTEYINFSGGEVFLRKDILEITDLAIKSGFKVSYTSNAGLITQEIARKVVEIGVDNITISLDGPKEVHEFIRKARIYDNIMNAVDWISREKISQGRNCPNLNFLCTVSRLNQEHLVELVGIAKEKGLPLTIDPIIFSNEENADNTKKELQGNFIKQESFIMSDEIGKIDTDMLEKEIETVLLRSKQLNQSVEMSIVGRKTRKKFFNVPDYSIVKKCFSPWYSCRIDPYGNVYPCSLSVAMGNLRQNSINEIINSDKAVNFRKRLKQKGLFDSCKKCCLLYSQNIFWNFLPNI